MKFTIVYFQELNGSGDAPLKPVDTAKTDTTDDSTEPNESNELAVLTIDPFITVINL